jgi:pantothenate kinase
VRAVVGLVGENVALLAGAFAQGLGAATVPDVVYAGSTLRDQDVLCRVLAEVTALLGSRALFLPHGEFGAAVGALSIARNQTPA